MLRSFLSLMAIALFWTALSPAQADQQSVSCPDHSLGEIQEDCPWAAISRTLSERAAHGADLDFATDLKELSPELYAQISHDSHETELKALWGESINFDELAHGVIIDPVILKALAKAFKVHYISDRISHAGTEHTYGYLFSTLKTSFGYSTLLGPRRYRSGIRTSGRDTEPERSKSQRWNSLLNATYFLVGRIAFRNDPKLLRILNHHTQEVAEALRNFDYDSLKPVRLEETIASKGVTLRSDMVPFTVKNPDPNANQYLLIYSVVIHGHSRLITGFPVERSFVDSTLNKEGLGDDKPIITRYNGFVPGVSGETFTGTRRVVSEP